MQTPEGLSNRSDGQSDLRILSDRRTKTIAEQRTFVFLHAKIFALLGRHARAVLRTTACRSVETPPQTLSSSASTEERQAETCEADA